MEKINELTSKQKDEEKLLIRKFLDKVKFCEARNKYESTDFLDLSEQEVLKKIIEKRKVSNVKFDGGYEQSERKKVIVFPEALNHEDLYKKNINQMICILRITLPNDLIDNYEHRSYLGALIKLGLKREKIGDIIVRRDGADIIVSRDIEKFLVENVKDLIRFQKSKIEIVEIEDLKYIPAQKKLFRINVPSQRLDAIVGEIARCSRSSASKLILEERVFVNFKLELRGTRQIQDGDYITIRGKGRFKINKFVGNTKSGRLCIEIEV